MKKLISLFLFSILEVSIELLVRTEP